MVEDDPDIRDSLVQILELEGYVVRAAANGREGLELLRMAERPCLILLDLMMPVMSGWEFMAERNGDVMLATIPVVVVSAAGEPAARAQANDYVKKPIDLEALLALVRKYCG